LMVYGSDRTTLSHCCARVPNRDPADVDAGAQISAFVKLKLANCACAAVGCRS
jgi:hypothetical protein